MRNNTCKRAWAAVAVGLFVAGALSGCESGTHPSVQEKTSVGRDPATGEQAKAVTPPNGGAPTGPADSTDKLGQGGGPVATKNPTSLGRVPGTFPAGDTTPGKTDGEARDAHAHDGAQKSPMKSTRQ